MSEDEFILVNRRRRRKKFEQVFREQLSLTESNEIEIDKEIVVRKLFDAVPKLKYSVFKTHILHNISKVLKILNTNKIFEIICYGLGRFSQHNSSKTFKYNEFQYQDYSCFSTRITSYFLKRKTKR
ncbi:uncharacterized protein LOC122636146 [Vespula pensylvanica]|uniref:uncharacterized protein LOC122636146 n=1 Tax=Vespula pensylvanica TaxID=30213 RepID=UPI001CB9E529|nr:uncharacterized protein LOC122636146 [Vespula pensylvanica]